MNKFFVIILLSMAVNVNAQPIPDNIYKYDTSSMFVGVIEVAMVAVLQDGPAPSPDPDPEPTPAPRPKPQICPVCDNTGWIIQADGHRSKCPEKDCPYWNRDGKGEKFDELGVDLRFDPKTPNFVYINGHRVKRLPPTNHYKNIVESKWISENLWEVKLSTTVRVKKCYGTYCRYINQVQYQTKRHALKNDFKLEPSEYVEVAKELENK